MSGREHQRRAMPESRWGGRTCQPRGRFSPPFTTEAERVDIEFMLIELDELVREMPAGGEDAAGFLDELTACRVRRQGPCEAARRTRGRTR